MMKIALVVFACVAVASARVRSCDRGALGPNPIESRITGCSNPNQVCRIIRGSNIVGEFDFISTSSASTLRPEITAYAFGVRAVYELPEDRQDGCAWLTRTFCPLDRGEAATYNLMMPIVDEYPLTTLDIEVRLYDQDNVIQFCTLIESEVVIS